MLSFPALAAPAIDKSAIDKPVYYTWRCNGVNLFREDRDMAIAWLQDRIEGKCKTHGKQEYDVDDNGPVPVNAFFGFRFAQGAPVTLRLWQKVRPVSQTTVSRAGVLEAVRELDKTCGSKGGSMAAPGFPEVTVHMSDKFV